MVWRHETRGASPPGGAGRALPIQRTFGRDVEAPFVARDDMGRRS
jgi:hypothetical protein